MIEVRNKRKIGLNIKTEVPGSQVMGEKDIK